MPGAGDGIEGFGLRGSIEQLFAHSVRDDAVPIAMENQQRRFQPPDLPQVVVSGIDGPAAQRPEQRIVQPSHRRDRGERGLEHQRAWRLLKGQLQGDTGARHLVEAELMPVIDVEIGEGAGIDVDTRDAMESAGGVLQD